MSLRSSRLHCTTVHHYPIVFHWDCICFRLHGICRCFLVLDTQIWIYIISEIMAIKNTSIRTNNIQQPNRFVYVQYVQYTSHTHNRRKCFRETFNSIRLYLNSPNWTTIGLIVNWTTTEFIIMMRNLLVTLVIVSLTIDISCKIDEE